VEFNRRKKRSSHIFREISAQSQQGVWHAMSTYKIILA
jgi:hypothetical protein